MSEAAILPVAHSDARARIEILDVLRGIAILGIFFLNIPTMAQLWLSSGEAAASATGLDQAVGWIDGLILEGTQRGMLEMLFGAGMMLLTARAMRDDGPIGVADTYFRRNLWLLGFGLLHLYLVRWPDDILHIYAIAALFLFPFRRLTPSWALALGLGYALFTVVDGAVGAFSGYDGDLTSGAWLAQEAAPAKIDPAPGMWDIDDVGSWNGIVEAVSTMLIGVALFKWGIIQCLRSRAFYLVLAVMAYGAGFAMRLWSMSEVEGNVPAGLDMSELGRIAVTVGHVALINLAWSSGVGRRLLGAFAAAGRTAFSLYVMQSIIGIWVLFAPWGVLDGGSLGPAGLAAVAAVVASLQLLVANLWLLRFESGPLEWLWRSLVKCGWHDSTQPRAALPV
ncbi:DUF418 domain-containing protein [Sphingopyxis terrae]|uniref:DUF418 domain-containing protein n=1 Tax=Sphingopyxis terrae TaxID=33052 RepID=UPI000787D80A|nr:DUF418 domain-containing protein [Sphingopyxis terrae]